MILRDLKEILNPPPNPSTLSFSLIYISGYNGYAEAPTPPDPLRSASLLDSPSKRDLTPVLSRFNPLLVSAPSLLPALLESSSPNATRRDPFYPSTPRGREGVYYPAHARFVVFAVFGSTPTEMRKGLTSPHMERIISEWGTTEEISIVSVICIAIQRRKTNTQGNFLNQEREFLERSFKEGRKDVHVDNSYEPVKWRWTRLNQDGK
jgi:hypothetical protein